MNIIEKVKIFVEEECKKPSSKYGYEPFFHHFIPMVNYAEKLSKKLWWDKEVIILASRLHDIWSIIYGRENHHITWTKIAEEKLTEFWYPKDKIELIKKCILNHRWSQNLDRETIEEKIVAEADVMSAFENISWIFKAAFIYENLNQEQAKNSVKQKYINKWNQLHFEESKEIIKPKYDALMVILWE